MTDAKLEHGKTQNDVLACRPSQVLGTPKPSKSLWVSFFEGTPFLWYIKENQKESHHFGGDSPKKEMPVLTPSKVAVSELPARRKY